jgi:lysyl-tRNA synthetase, class II
MAGRLDQIIASRKQKIENLKARGVNPYAHKFDKTHTVSEANAKTGSLVQTAGRILSLRGHGALTFLDLVDQTGKIQVLLNKKELKEAEDFVRRNLDSGDFIGVKGEVFVTKAGETTINVIGLTLLTKSILPLPDSWYGLKDEEERYRLRYLDLLLSDDLKKIFERKAIFWQSIRNFLIERGFLEVETPVLENTAGGADANPFITHHNALDIDLFLRISMGELWQKRLMVAGFEKTFEIGRQFRNEGLSREHLQDYTQMEFYWAYADYNDSMKLTEDLYKDVAQKTFGTQEFVINGHKVNFSQAWKKIDYRDTILKETGIDIETATLKEIKDRLKDLNVKHEATSNKGRLIDYLWKTVRKGISGPVFLTGHPVEVSPLAKRKEGFSEFVERFQIIIAGSELGNGYSELNDPADQEERFSEQQKARDEGDSEAQMHDEDFVRALKYGMPPVTGFGLSERLFSFLAGLPIRETVLFPLLRPEK